MVRKDIHRPECAESHLEALCFQGGEGRKRRHGFERSSTGAFSPPSTSLGGPGRGSHRPRRGCKSTGEKCGLEAQLKGLYEEMQALTRKSPNDAINKFKLELINNILGEVNPFLASLGYPLKYIQGFKEDVLPFNSDVLLVLSQYLSRMENLRANNIKPGGLHLKNWYWVVDDNSDNIQTAPPKKIKE